MRPPAPPKPAEPGPDETPRQEPGAPPLELVRRFYSALNRWDGLGKPEFSSLLSPEFAQHQSGIAVGGRGPEFRVTTQSLPDYLLTLRALRQAVPDLYATLEAVTEAGENLAEARVTLRGTHFRRDRYATAVRHVQLPMKHLWRGEGGRLAECWAAEDGLGGILAAAGEGATPHANAEAAEPPGEYPAAYWLEHTE